MTVHKDLQTAFFSRLFFFLMIRRPPRSTLFPYTTLFRSQEKTAELAPLISAQGLSKRYGSAPLFQNLSFTVSEGERIGVIGPNGSGKSTLIEMLYGRVKPDGGVVAVRKGTRMSCVTQISEFSPRSEEHTSELQSRLHLVCRLLLEKKKKKVILLRTHFDITTRGVSMHLTNRPKFTP